MRFFKSKIFLVVVAFIGGVAMADTVKPMLAKLPLVGKFFGGSAE